MLDPTSKENLPTSDTDIPVDDNEDDEEFAASLAVDPGALGFFAAGDNQNALSLRVVGPRNVDMSPDEIITATDGGWGWVIVFISFFANMIIDGIVFSFGLIQDQIIYNYEMYDPDNPDIEGIPWAGSLLLGVICISGPMTSALADKFGFRAVGMVGSWIAGIGFMITACSADPNTGLPNVPVMITSFGIVSGLAAGMIYMPSVIFVGYYFDKRRALAVGLAMSGTGCGTFIIALLAKELNQVIGWQGTVLVEGMLLFSCSLIGSLFRPLVDNYEEKSFKDLNKIAKQMRSAVVETHESHEEEVETKPSSASPSKKSHSSIRITRFGRLNSVRSLTSALNHEMDEETYDRTTLNNSNHSRIFESSIGGMDVTFEEESPVVVQVPSQSIINRPTVRPGAYVGGRIEETHDGRQYVYTAPRSSSNRKAIGKINAELRRRLVSRQNMESGIGSLGVPDSEDTDVIIEHDEELSCFARLLQSIRTFRIVTMPTFWILAITGVLVTFGYPIPFLYIGVIAEEKGVPHDRAVSLLSFIGMANTVGRILSGYLSDNPKVNPLYLTCFSTIFSGLVTLLMPLVVNSLEKGSEAVYPVFLIYSLLYGISLAAFTTLRSILIRDYIGLSALASAFGFTLAFQGMAAIASSPMAAALKSLTGNCNLAFVTAGAVQIAGSLAQFLLPLAYRRQKAWDDAEKAKQKKGSKIKI